MRKGTNNFRENFCIYPQTKPCPRWVWQIDPLQRACNSMRQCQALCVVCACMCTRFWKTKHFTIYFAVSYSTYRITWANSEQRRITCSSVFNGLMYAQYVISISTFAPIFHSLHRYFISFNFITCHIRLHTHTHIRAHADYRTYLYVPYKHEERNACMYLFGLAIPTRHERNEKPSHWIVYSFWIFHAR